LDTLSGRQKKYQDLKREIDNFSKRVSAFEKFMKKVFSTYRLEKTSPQKRTSPLAHHFIVKYKFSSRAGNAIAHM